MWLRIGKWASFTLFFVTVLLIAVYLTFPNSTLKFYLQDKIERSIFPNGGGHIEIGNASLWRISGADMRDIVIFEGSGEDENAPKWKIEKLQARFGIWRALFGKMRLVINGDLFGASASAAFNFNEAKQLSDFWIDMEGLNLAKMPLVAEKLGFPLQGSASLQMDFDAGINPAVDASGTFKLEVADFGLSDGFITLSGMPLKIPQTKLGKLSANIDIAKGTATSKTLGFSGGEIDCTSDLALKLNKDFKMSEAAGKGWLKFSDSYIKKVPALSAILPPDGKLYFKAEGLLGRLSPRLVTKADFEQKAPNKPSRNLTPKR